MKYLIALLAILLQGCATTANTPLKYVPASPKEGGYFERQRDTHKWLVGTYYSLDTHTPQQAANINMLRAAEIANENGYAYMRVLNYDENMRRVTRKMQGGVSIDESRRNATISNDWIYQVNRDQDVPDEYFKNGITFANVEYFEFARDVNCSTEKCEESSFLLENCMAGGDAGAAEMIKKCNLPDVAAAFGGSTQECQDRLQFITRDACKSIIFAAFKWRGSVDERNGAWYSINDVLSKYRKRVDDWVNIRPRKVEAPNR